MNHRNSDQRTNGEDESEIPTNEATKRGAVAASTFVVGSSALDNENAATVEDEAESDEEMDRRSADEGCSQHGQLVLVSLLDYWPGLTVRVVDRLPVPIVVQLLRLPNDDTVPVLTQPDEYTGYVVRSEPGDEQVYSTMFVFTRGTLETDAYYTFGTDTHVFSTQLNLFRVTACRVDPQDEENGDAEATSDGSTETETSE